MKAAAIVTATKIPLGVQGGRNSREDGRTRVAEPDRPFQEFASFFAGGSGDRTAGIVKVDSEVIRPI